MVPPKVPRSRAMGSRNMDATQLEQALVGRQGVAAGATELVGPVRVLETIPSADGGTTYQVSASRLVPVDDDDPDLASVYIPVPVTAAVEVDGHDTVVGVAIPDADPSLDHQARVFTRNLIANGAVRGLAPGGSTDSSSTTGGAPGPTRAGPVKRGPVKRGPAGPAGPVGPVGPPPRATHEVTTDAAGRRVIRRTGFTTSLAPTGAPTLDARAHDGTDEPPVSRGGTHR